MQLGDLSELELRARFEGEPPVRELVEERRIFLAEIAGEARWAAAEDAARYRDALGVALPGGLPRELLEPVADPLGDLVSRWARTHGPFHVEDLAARWGISAAWDVSTAVSLQHFAWWRTTSQRWSTSSAPPERARMSRASRGWKAEPGEKPFSPASPRVRSNLIFVCTHSAWVRVPSQ